MIFYTALHFGICKAVKNRYTKGLLSYHKKGVFMAANNQSVIIGRAGGDAVENLRYVNGTAVCQLNLAVNRPTKDQMGNNITDWIQVQFWDKRAERFSEFVKKGDLISVSGALRVENWEKEGQKRSKTYINGEDFQMLESRSARESRQGAEGSPMRQQSQQRNSYGGGQSAPGSRRQAPAQDDFADDFALGDDELPPF